MANPHILPTVFAAFRLFPTILGFKIPNSYILPTVFTFLRGLTQKELAKYEKVSVDADS